MRASGSPSTGASAPTQTPGDTRVCELGELREKKKEKKRSETRIVTTLCKLRTPNADVVCDIDTMKGDSGEENCDVLPVV